MIERLGFFTGKGEHFFHSRSVGDVAYHLGFGSGANLLFHFHAHGLKIEPHFLQNVHRHALPQFDQTKKQMLRAHVIVIEPVGLLASKRQDLLSARSKIIHRSTARQPNHCPTPSPFY